MSEIKLLYLHGLGRTDLRPGERAIFASHRRPGVNVVAAEIDWRAAEKFVDLRDRITEQALGILDETSEDGVVAIEGSSAGGSLAFNVAHQIDDKRLRVISHSGRLLAGNYKTGSRKRLERCAHLGTSHASKSFYDSVRFFETETLPEMSIGDMERSLITIPWADEVVPVSTMTVHGIKTVTVPIIGHSPGIGLGMLRTPKLIDENLS